MTLRQIAAICVTAKKSEQRFDRASVRHVITTVFQEGVNRPPTTEELVQLQQLFWEEFDDIRAPRKHAFFSRCRKPSD